MRMTKAGTAPTPPSPSAGTSTPMSDPAGMLPLTPPDHLRRAEKLGLALFALLIGGLGIVTEIRSAFLASPKTDFQVYARAGWAVRAGEDIYYHFDNNGWHYCYPPPFAVLMAPLADPYPFLPRQGYLPFAVSVAVWYLIGVGCAWYAVRAFASALLPGTPRGWVSGASAPQQPQCWVVIALIRALLDASMYTRSKAPLAGSSRSAAAESPHAGIVRTVRVHAPDVVFVK